MNAESNSQIMRIKKTKDLTDLLVKNMGYSFDRQTGSHMIYKKPNAAPLSIPNEREIARGTLRNLARLIQ